MKINGLEFTIGADPEIFVGHKGQFISAHGMVPGTKENPFKVDKGAVQVDGMALEFNIDPSSNKEEFEFNLDFVQKQLKGMIGDKDFLEDASVFFDKDFIQNVPKENLELGCDPDFSAYTLSANPKPSGKNLMRTAGGHVHVGGISKEQVGPDHFQVVGKLTRIIDETLGVFSVLWDKDDKRRAMYGKAGCFRPKPYGMEYRTLSNAWIFKKSLVHFVYDSIVESLEKMFQQDYEPDPVCKEIIDGSLRDHIFFKGNKKAETINKIMGV